MSLPEKIANKNMDWKEHVGTYTWVKRVFIGSTLAIIAILAGMLLLV